MLWLVITVGYNAGRLLLVPITFYFFATGRSVRIASRNFLSRALGRDASFGDVFRHLLTFSHVMLDRVFFLLKRIDRFDVDIVGLEILQHVIVEGRGCILVGGHLGSFEVLRSVGRHSPVPVRALMFRHATGVASRIYDELDQGFRDSVIEVGKPDSMLRVRESLDRGELVGILSDRTLGGEKYMMVPFLGKDAAFPTGPLILAAALHAPVLLFYGVRTGVRRYEVGFRYFANEIVLRRECRNVDLRRWLEQYAAWLEEMCRLHPFNWFNFYDFWEKPRDATPI